jgi:hypothetical protein
LTIELICLRRLIAPVSLTPFMAKLCGGTHDPLTVKCSRANSSSVLPLAELLYFVKETARRRQA